MLSANSLAKGHLKKRDMKNPLKKTSVTTRGVYADKVTAPLVRVVQEPDPTDTFAVEPATRVNDKLLAEIQNLERRVDEKLLLKAPLDNPHFTGEVHAQLLKCSEAAVVPYAVTHQLLLQGEGDDYFGMRMEGGCMMIQKRGENVASFEA